MIVVPHFKLYPALFHLKWLIYKPNISAVQGNVIFEMHHDFYRTAITFYIHRNVDFRDFEMPAKLWGIEQVCKSKPAK